MLEKFGTPLKVFSATTSELAKVEGLGEARAKKIKNMLISKNKPSNTKKLWRCWWKWCKKSEERELCHAGGWRRGWG
jgi:DNA repair protein RadC